MSTSTVESLSGLYLEDETAWLEHMAGLIAARRFADLDYPNLREFLSDMARRDRQEVLSWLTVLIAHRLKWEHQPEKRSTSWRATIAEQRRELEQIFESGTLHNHAREVLPKAYRSAVEHAAIETGLAESAFPPESDRSLDDWMLRTDVDESA
jgi:hypothetical protein